jgi:hypothetical protein
MGRHKASHSRAVKQHLTRSVTKEVASMGDPEEHKDEELSVKEAAPKEEVPPVTEKTETDPIRPPGTDEQPEVE